MPTYRVIEKATGQTVSAYAAMGVVEGEYPLTSYDHVEYLDDEPVVQRGPRKLTKLQFIERMGDPAYAAILQMAKADIGVEVFMRKFEATTPDEDGTSINLDDPRTIAGVNAIGATLEAQQIVEPGWADEVLNG